MTLQPSHWKDFNNAGQQMGFALIPKGTLIKVRLTIKPGGFDDASRGWTGGWATESDQTGSIYLNAQYVVLDGPYAKRKLWSTIGLYSAKGSEWASMGRAFIRAALNSARGVLPDDTSAQAQAARRIQHLGELDGLVFVGRVDVQKDSQGEDKNVVKQAIEPDHPEYPRLMGGVAPATSSCADSMPATDAPPATPPCTAPMATDKPKPAWAL